MHAPALCLFEAVALLRRLCVLHCVCSDGDVYVIVMPRGGAGRSSCCMKAYEPMLFVQCMVIAVGSLSLGHGVCNSSNSACGALGACHGGIGSDATCATNWQDTAALSASLTVDSCFVCPRISPRAHGVEAFVCTV